MGIYIKGMEMPESCIKCKLCVSYKCVPTGEIRWSDEFDYDSKRFENCPLVPVPPHGRLVDTRGMFLPFVVEGQRSKRYHLGEKWELNGAEIRKVIDSLPTVIEAEEGE